MTDDGDVRCDVPDGIYRVWFYNHRESFVMKFANGRWYKFECDETPDDEIDVHDRPPVLICE